LTAHVPLKIDMASPNESQDPTIRIRQRRTTAPAKWCVYPRRLTPHSDAPMDHIDLHARVPDHRPLTTGLSKAAAGGSLNGPPQQYEFARLGLTTSLSNAVGHRNHGLMLDDPDADARFARRRGFTPEDFDAGERIGASKRTRGSTRRARGLQMTNALAAPTQFRLVSS
jgi:hypothetical protein